MYLCITPAPALDRTASTANLESQDTAHALRDLMVLPAGGGMNVAHLLYLAGQDTTVVVPAPSVSHYVRVVNRLGIPCDIVEVPGPIPVHFKVRDDSGTDIEFRDLPMPLDAAQLAMLRDHAISLAENASWLVLAGELPQVANTAWFVDVMRATRLYHPSCKIAVATTGPALSAVLRQVFTTRPDVVVLDWQSICVSTTEEEVVDTLRDAGVEHVLVCESQQYFRMYTGNRVRTAEWAATAEHNRLPWIDAALAGLLFADPYLDADNALKMALAYANCAGRAETTQLPTPDSVDMGSVRLS